ncbi:hypothetical protein K490DRAFT_73916 [Saccharata proteae CBS 121410]|uniref:Nucleoporin Nup82 n=1 Tax=Saccharata proteae CBS 121410 TaxID=1314787 RepID=A0A9P4HV93_9PEZI|nr:hypothetical protein K490DRAFT_73916 [Saccharata proteae CBS 121410]
MPRVLSYLPPWLSRGQPGFELFAQPQKSPRKVANGTSNDETPTARRSVAHRGNEIFVASGNELRWASLATLKDQGASITNAYRTLKLNVSGQISQIILSPNEDYMAICTSHTVHIAVLPDSHHLAAADNTPLKLKTFHLGPTVHVLDHAALASVLWHPLGHHGRCLVTVTTDANVRLWEFNKDNRVSFSEPELAIDLKKLATGVNSMDDFRASRINDKTGYSPDSFELEVASACFGSPSSRSGGRGWSPMTLWVAMKAGDIYALCPLLPRKWQYITDRETPLYLHSLEIQVQAKSADDEDNTPDSAYTQQSEWLEALDFALEEDRLTGDRVELYTRPSRPGPVPKLQGPFYLDPEIDSDADFEITDILVLEPPVENPVMPADEDMFEEMPAHEDSPALPVICITTSAGLLHVCLNFESVEGHWLPRERKPASTLKFTTDPASPTSFFISHEFGVFHVSLSPWLPALQDELLSLEAQEHTTELRIDALMSSSTGTVQQLIDYGNDAYLHPTNSANNFFTSCIAIASPSLGHFVLSTTGPIPHAVILEPPTSSLTHIDASSPTDTNIPFTYPPETLETPQPWPVYQPPPSLFSQSTIPSFLVREAHARHRQTLQSEIRLSTATLELLGKAHREIAAETQRLGVAASSLFTRCQWLQNELRDQIRKAGDVAGIVDEVTGGDEGGYDAVGAEAQGKVGKERIEERLEGVRAKQRKLIERTEKVRAKLGSESGRRVVSEKERAWFAEVEKLKATILDQDAEDLDPEEAKLLPARRLQAVKELKDEYVALAKELQSELKDRVDEGERRVIGEQEFRVPSGYRENKVRVVMELLAREEAMVEGVVGRLRRLNGANA